VATVIEFVPTMTQSSDRRSGDDRRSGHDRRSVDLWRETGRSGFEVRTGADRRTGGDRRQDDRGHTVGRRLTSAQEIVTPWQLPESQPSGGADRRRAE
jgi:hypothetical protein